MEQNMSLAAFDESGGPVELNQMLQKFQAEIQQKQQLIATERQLIAEAEHDIKEKQEAASKLDSENGQLEMAIQHTGYIFENQKHQLKTLQDTAATLKMQVRMAEECFEKEQETKSKILSDCEAKYQEYQEMVDRRMKQYDAMPMVAKLRKEEVEIEKLRLAVEEHKQENEKLKLDIEERKARRDPSKLKYKNIIEWGVALAKHMCKYKKAMLETPKKLERVHKLRQEVESLEHKIENMKLLKEQEKPVPVGATQSDSVECLPVHSTSQQSGGRKKFKLASMVPKFDEGFFKRKVSNKQHPGSSGSSMRSSTLSSSLPNIPSLFLVKDTTNITKSMEDLKVKTSTATETSPKTKEKKLQKPCVSEKSPCSTLQRSKSLSVLMPQLKPMQKLETFKSSSILGRSLSDWLKSSPIKENNSVEVEKVKASDTTKVDSKTANLVSPQKPTISFEKPSFKWPQPPSVQMTADHKVTEVPLIRQMQEKLMQKKAIEQGEKLLQEHAVSQCIAPDDDMEVVEEIDEELSQQSENTSPSNMMSFFDGPVYDVPMPSPEEDSIERPENKSPAPSICSSTSTTPEMNKDILEEHRKMLAEIDSSPGFDFKMASNFLTAGNMDTDTPIMLGQKTPSPHKSRDFKFAVPTAPGPGSKKKFKSPENSFFLDFGIPRTESPSTSSFDINFSGNESTSPPSFSFEANPEEQSTNAVSPFSFGASFGLSESKSPDKSPGESSGASGFSFGNMFGSEPKSPNDNERSFSFNFGEEKNDQTEKSSLFSFTSNSPEQQSDFLFSNVFGCKK